MRTPVFALSMFLSGAAALIYEIAWVRRLGDLLGQDLYAITTVLTVFFAGLGIGGWLFGTLADRWSGHIGLYVGLELVIAGSALLFDPALSLLDGVYSSWAPAEWPWHVSLAAKGVLSLLILAVPTLAMGGTLTAMSRHIITHHRDVAGLFGWLYGANTLGAAVGVLGATFAMIPVLGVGVTIRSAVALNVAAALIALFAARKRVSIATSVESSATSAAPTLKRGDRWIPLFVAFSTGFVSIGFELLWTRGLAMRFVSGVYSFAIILCAYLVCIAIGSALVRFLDRRGWVTPMTCAAVLIAAGIAGTASPVALSTVAQSSDLYFNPDQQAGFVGLEWRQFVRAFFVMASTMVLFGMSLPILVRLATHDVKRLGASAGAIYLFNSAGAVMAPVAIGFVVMPSAGLNHSFVILGVGMTLVGTLAVLPWALGNWRRAVKPAAVILPIAMVVAAVAETFDVRAWRSHPEAKLVAYLEGPAASIAVIDHPDRGRILQVNYGYTLGGSRGVFAQRRQGLLPLLVRTGAQRVLVLGLGTGSTAGAAYQMPGVAVDALEIIPGVFDMLDYYRIENFDITTLAENHDGLRLLNLDARHYVRATGNRYDVVIGDLFEPWRRGVGAMYTLEHFQAVQRLLTPDGSFWQWLPLYQLSDEGLRTVLRTFVRVFDHVDAWWLSLNAQHPAIALVGSRHGYAVDEALMADRLQTPGLGELFMTSGFLATAPILGSWVAERATLAEFAGDGPVNTVDRPLIEFNAPRSLLRGSPRWGNENMLKILELSKRAESRLGHRFGNPKTAETALRYRRSIKHMLMAHSAMLAGRIDESVDRMSLALEQTPEWGYPVALLKVVIKQALAEDRGDDFDGVLAVFQGRPKLRYLADYWRARRAIEQGHLDEAEEYLRASIEAKPDEPASIDLLRRIEKGW